MRNIFAIVILSISTLAWGEIYYPKGTPGYGYHTGNRPASNAPCPPQGPGGRPAVCPPPAAAKSAPCGCSAQCDCYTGYGTALVEADGYSPGQCKTNLKRKCGNSCTVKDADFFSLEGGDEKCERNPGGVDTPPPPRPPVVVRPPKPVPTGPVFVKYVCGGCYEVSSYEGANFTGRGGSTVYKGCFKVSKRFSDSSEEPVGSPICTDGTVRGAWEDKCNALKRADTRCN